MAAMALSLSPFAVVSGATAVPRVGRTSRSAARSTARILPRHRHALVVKCQSEPEMEPILEKNAADQPTPNPNPAPNKSKPEASSKLSDVLAFSGPGPERINGRLAMVGFVAALVVEAARGDGLLSQAGSGAGAAWFAGTAAVLTAASLVPLLRGESVQDRTEGVMNANAELWNGRFAMVGLVALAFTEYLKGGPLV